MFFVYVLSLHWKPRLLFKQQIVILIGTDPVLYWANFFLFFFFKFKYVEKLISNGSPCVYQFHETSRFTDNLCTINDDGKFSSSYKYIYPKQLELKLEHRGEHSTFLDLDITIEDSLFVYKFF